MCRFPRRGEWLMSGRGGECQANVTTQCLFRHERLTVTSTREKRWEGKYCRSQAEQFHPDAPLPSEPKENQEK